MGILNITEDSFYAGSRATAEDAVSRAIEMLNDGASIIDLGAQSTRPGSTRIPPEEEIRRLLPVIQNLISLRPDIILSVDTYHASVAREAIEAGALMINDISAGEMDPLMASTVADQAVPYVCMHMQGRPENMQENPQYSDVVAEQLEFFHGKLNMLRSYGIRDIILDPGFGFGKTIEHNFSILQSLEAYHELGQPIMVGLSRKSFIQKTLNVTSDGALNGSTVLHAVALIKGANILRVHDVREAVEAVRLCMKIIT